MRFPCQAALLNEWSLPRAGRRTAIAGLLTWCALTSCALIGCGSRESSHPIASPTTNPPVATSPRSSPSSELDATGTLADSSNQPDSPESPQQPDHSNAIDNTPSALPVTASADTVLPNTVSADAASAQLPANRIMLLTPAGPLVVDLTITVAGQSPDSDFENRLDQILELADQNGDGVVPWMEILEHPRFRHGQFGNPPTTSYQAAQEMIRLYDTIANGRVDRLELPKYLSSNQARSHSITFQTSRSNHVLNVEDSATFQWLDQNGDRRLDATEMASTRQRLRLRDSDDDDILRPADFGSAFDSAMQSSARNDNFYSPNMGWQLNEQTRWQELLFAWTERYGMGGAVGPQDLGFASPKFDRLDVDGDQQLRSFEMSLLLDVAPDLQITVALPSERQAPVIELTDLQLNHQAIASQPQDNRVFLSHAKFMIDIGAHQTAITYDADAQAANVIARADADQNGYLDETEYEAAASLVAGLPWEAADWNTDQQVTADELATLLDQRQILGRSQWTIVANERPDPFFDFLDENRDGRIDSRELIRAPERMLTLDHNEDGYLLPEELPACMRIAVIRGTANIEGGGETQGQDLFPPITPQPHPDAPDWFVAMDRNQDQVISPREFIGTRDQFSRLDTNRNELIEVDEL